MSTDSILNEILYGLGAGARRATTIGGDPDAVASVRSGERLMADEDARRAMALNPAHRGVMDPILDEVAAGYRGTTAPPTGDIALPAAPPPMMMTPRPSAPPPSRGVPLRPTGEAVKRQEERGRVVTPPSTEGGTATGPANPSVAGAPPRIPAWMAAGAQPRFGPSDAQDDVFADLAGHLGPGETLSRVAPGSMANVYSDIGFDQAMDARDQAALARTNTSIDQEKAAQVLDDLTGGTQKRIRGLALDNALVDLLPAGSRSKIGANFGEGWGPGLAGAEVGSSAVGETPLGQPSIGEEKAMDRVIAGQQGKMASAQNERAARQAQIQIVGDLRHKKGMIQAKLAAGAIDAKGAQAEWEYEKQLADRELQALGGGKDFLSQYRNDMGGESVFSTDQKGG